MRAVMGATLQCPVCGRVQQGVTLRSGDAWLTCWHQRCLANLWAVRVAASVPTAADIADAVGERIAASLLLTYAPGPLIVLEVPAAVRGSVVWSSRLVLLARLTTALLGDKPVTPAIGPEEKAAA